MVIYRRPKFLETLLEIRRELAHSVDYDVDLFVQMVRSGDDLHREGHPERVDRVEPTLAFGHLTDLIGKE